ERNAQRRGSAAPPGAGRPTAPSAARERGSAARRSAGNAGARKGLWRRRGRGDRPVAVRRVGEGLL
ncbi:MAG: hypothetical protein AVDCRST_MAG39-2153, partial [uncultured Sphingomonadaceae bacterium]